MATGGDRPSALVLGIGNLLMGDEGVGVHVARLLQDRLAGRRDIEVVDGGTGGLNLLEYFSRTERLFIVDATADGAVPGTVQVQEPRFSADFPPTLTAHDIGLKDMLDAAHLLQHRPHLVLVTISVQGVDQPSLELSPPVEGAIREAATCVEERLPTAPA